jgi:hypothetical protein
MRVVIDTPHLALSACQGKKEDCRLSLPFIRADFNKSGNPMLELTGDPASPTIDASIEIHRHHEFIRFGVKADSLLLKFLARKDQVHRSTPMVFSIM